MFHFSSSKFKVSLFGMLCPLFVSRAGSHRNLALHKCCCCCCYSTHSPQAGVIPDGSAIAWFAIVTCFVAVFLRLFAKTTKDQIDDCTLIGENYLVVNCNAPRHGDLCCDQRHDASVASPRRRPTREKGPPRQKDDDDVVVICVVVVVVKDTHASMPIFSREKRCG